MSLTLATAVTKVKLILQNETISFHNVSDALEDCVADAVDRYNQDRPVSANETVLGNATGIIDMPATFTWEFSVLKTVEYPVGNARPTYLETKDYTTYRETDGNVQLRLYLSLIHI